MQSVVYPTFSGTHGNRRTSVAVQAAATEAIYGLGRANVLRILVPDVAGLKVALHEVRSPTSRSQRHRRHLGFIHRKLENEDLYFLANTGNTPLHTAVQFRSKYTDGEWLNADTGSSRAVSACSPVPLDLAPYESRLLLLRQGLNLHPRSGLRTQKPLWKTSARDWRVHFELAGHEEPMPELVTWTQRKRRSLLRHRHIPKSFDAPSTEKKSRLLLYFGEGKPTVETAASEDHPGMHAEFEASVRDAAIVYMNGKVAGSLWHPPYEVRYNFAR